MPRMLFWNVQKLGASSGEEKLRAIVSTCRNFYTSWPDIVAFVELSTGFDKRYVKAIGGEIFAPTTLVPWGYRFSYCVIDPHVPVVNSKEGPTEFFGMLRYLSRSKTAEGEWDNDLLTLDEARYDTDIKYDTRLSPLGVGTRSPPGVRRLARHEDAESKTTILLLHPSPAAAPMSVKDCLRYMEQKFPRGKVIAVGDFNWDPASEKLQQFANERGFKIASPTSLTHEDGVLDYVIHSDEVVVSNVNVLTKDIPSSDHWPIYFDFS